LTHYRSDYVSVGKMVIGSLTWVHSDHHDNGVYRIQHDPSHRSHHADDDNLHRRGDEGRAHRRDDLDDCLYQCTQQEWMLALAIQ
jgi:hypothetical protein